MISWATIRDDNAAGSREDGQTEEAALHAYRSRYEDALHLTLDGQFGASIKMFEDILGDMDASRFKDLHIRFLVLANLSRVHEKEENLNDAYSTILSAIELNPGDINAVTRGAWLAFRLGDSWTARALLNSDVFCREGIACLETIILRNCQNIALYESEFQVPLSISSSDRAVLGLDSEASCLDDFLNQLSNRDFWRCEDVIVRRSHPPAAPTVEVSLASNSPETENEQLCPARNDCGDADALTNDDDLQKHMPESSAETPTPAESTARRSRRNTARSADSTDDSSEVIGFTENIEVLLRRVSDSIPAHAKAGATPLSTNKIMFQNLYKKIESIWDHELSATSVTLARSLPMAGAGQSFLVESSQLTAMASLRKKLCIEDDRAINISKLAFDVLLALSADSIAIAEYSTSVTGDAMDGEASEGFTSQKDLTKDFGILKTIFHQIWPVVAAEYTLEHGALGLAEFIMGIPETAAVFAAECLLDEALQRNILLDDSDCLISFSLETLLLRWSFETATIDNLFDGEMLTGDAKLRVRRDWLLLQYDMEAASRGAPNNAQNSLDFASQALVEVLINRNIAISLPYLSEKLNLLQKSTVACVGKLPPVRALLQELTRPQSDCNLSSEYNDLDTVASQIDRAAAIYDSCQDWSSFLCGIKAYFLGSEADQEKVDAEVILFIRYLRLCRLAEKYVCLSWKWVAAVERVCAIVSGELNNCELTDEGLAAVSLWAAPLFSELNCLNKINLADTCRADEFQPDLFKKVFRALSLFSLLLTQSSCTNSSSSKLCILCIDNLDKLLSACSSRFCGCEMLEDSFEVCVGLCMYYWECDYGFCLNAANKVINKQLFSVFSTVLRTVVLSPSSPHAIRAGDLFMRLSLWLFHDSRLEKQTEACIATDCYQRFLKFLLSKFSAFNHLSKTLNKHGQSIVSSSLEVNQFVSVIVIMESIYWILYRQSCGDYGLDINELVGAFCVCAQEMSTNLFFNLDGGLVHSSILSRILPIMYNSDACIDLVGSNVVDAATAILDSCYVACAKAMDIQRPDQGPLLEICKICAQLCFDLYKIPVLLPSVASGEGAVVGSNLQSNTLNLVVPETYLAGIYIFLKFWDDSCVTLHRSTWCACLGVLYKVPPLSDPPQNEVSNILRFYLFGRQSDGLTWDLPLHCFESDGHLCNRATETCQQLLEIRESRHELRMDTDTDSVNGCVDLFDWVRGDFYVKYFENGGTGLNSTAFMDSVEKRRPESSVFSRIKRSTELSATRAEVGVDYYFNFVCEAEQKYCPFLTLAFQCLSYCHKIETLVDIWVKILNALYELANSSQDEMTSYLFPISEVSEEYRSAPLLDDLDIPECGMENIFLGIFSLTPFGPYPSILSYLCQEVQCDHDSENTDNNIRPLDYQRIEEFVLWGTNPTPHPNFSYFRAVQFLCSYHKSVSVLFDRAYSFLFAKYFTRHILSDHFLDTPLKMQELIKFMLDNGRGRSVSSYGNDVTTAYLSDCIGPLSLSSGDISKSSISKKAVSATEMKVLLEFNRSTLVDGDGQGMGCLRRSLKHALQGLSLCKCFDIPNLFLPIFASAVSHELGMSIEPILCLIYYADNAYQSLGVEKRMKVQVMYHYHYIRLQTCWKWLKECYAGDSDATDLTFCSNGSNTTPGKLSQLKYGLLTADLNVLDGCKISTLTTGPGSAAVNAVYLPSPMQLTIELKKISNLGEHARSNGNITALSASSTPGSGQSEYENSAISCEHLMSKLWIIILESVSGLKNCRKLDNFDCKSVCELSSFLSTLLADRSVVIPQLVIESLKSAGISANTESAADFAWKMFERKRSTMLVALWREDKGKSSNRFDQIVQRQHHYDELRMKYIDRFIDATMHSGRTHLKQICELTLTSLTIAELTPVMLVTMRKCVSTFTTLLNTLAAKGYFLPSTSTVQMDNSNASFRNSESLERAGKEISSSQFTLHDACNVYEAALTKVKIGILPKKYKSELLFALVRSIRAENSVAVEKEAPGQQAETVISYETNYSQFGIDYVPPEESDKVDEILQLEVKKWMDDAGRVWGDYGKKSSTKRSRVSRQIPTVLGATEQGAPGDKGDIEIASKSENNNDIQLCLEDENCGDEKRRRTSGLCGKTFNDGRESETPPAVGNSNQFYL